MKKISLFIASLFIVLVLKAQENTNYGTNAGNSGSYNTSLGYKAGDVVTNNNNTFIGYMSGALNTTGYANNFFGYVAGATNLNGYHNSFYGYGSGTKQTSGNYNSFFGNYSGLNNISGNNNMYMGCSAGTMNTSGSNNTFLGYSAGYLNTGSNNVFLGNMAGYNETSSDKLYIDNSNTTSPLIYGDFATDVVNINGKLGIGTTTPQSKLDVNGDIYINSGIDDNHVYWGGHNMSFGTKPGEWANNIFSLKPGGTSQGKLSSEFNMYVANSPTSNELKVKISTDGISYFNGGNVLIGKTTQTNSIYKLDVAGSIRANEVKINATGADFVFAPTYNLRPLSEVESFIKQNQHLPEIAPAAEMQKDGVGVSEMQTKLLQKLEELTLYMIEQQKQIKELKLENEKLKKKVGIN